MNPRIWLKSIVRVLVLTAVLWTLVALLGYFIRIVPGWSFGAVAFGVALAAEVLILLYGYESRTMGPRRARQLVALRLASLGVLTWILLEPTFVRTAKRKFNRQVAVLWDHSASMDLKDDGETKSRLAIAREAAEKSGILKKLGDRVRLREFQFARSPETESRAPIEGWNQATDIAAALDAVLEDIPPDELAGALVLTDGRHNRPSRVEDSARRFGILDAPLGIVAVGSPEPPRDAAVLEVRSPDAIHLGDKLRVSADLKIDGYNGKQVKVRLTRGEKLIEEKEISVPQDRHREEVRFIHLPEEGGTGDYKVTISPLEGERFAENNMSAFDTSITDARTNVLLVDSFPRWEFRYLRNLFYGRDKSIQLQWMLLHPDQAEGQVQPDIAASATRPFGQAAASRLPENESEWRKFDVIILGDIPTDTISEDTWKIISRCVTERGALLVFSSGPLHMPHALDSDEARKLLPVELAWNHRSLLGDTGNPFRLSMTSEGRQHPVTRHATGTIANEQVWASFPPLQWRHPVDSVKDGAEILLTAEDEESAETAPEEATGLDAALDGIALRRKKEAKRALLVTRQTGNGKVAVVLTDRTWRLREGAGDVHHHRFWGNLVRWGAGPLLRAGSNNIALGTDQLTYTGDDPIIITARLRDKDLKPLVDPSLRAEILRDGKVVGNVPLASVPDSNGLHEGKSAPIRSAGLYQVRIVGKEAAQLLKAEKRDSLETGIRVVGARGPIELADTTLDRPMLEEAAKSSGGKVVAPADIASLIPLFLTEGSKQQEIRETPLWDNAFVFAVLAVLLTTEWWLRRNSGLP